MIKTEDEFMKTAKFVTITIILLLITTFSITGTVMSQNKDRDPIDAKHYRIIENEYIAQVRKQLEQQGYKNAGITMTRITEADGSREYTVLVHHRRINSLDEAERIQLANDLNRTYFPVEGCGFVYEFLE